MKDSIKELKLEGDVVISKEESLLAKEALIKHALDLNKDKERAKESLKDVLKEHKGDSDDLVKTLVKTLKDTVKTVLKGIMTDEAIDKALEEFDQGDLTDTDKDLEEWPDIGFDNPDIPDKPHIRVLKDSSKDSE